MSPLGYNIELHLHLPNEANLVNTKQHDYLSIVGGITYLVSFIRPDLIFTVSALSQHLHYPCNLQILLAKQALFYISRIFDHTIYYPHNLSLNSDIIQAVFEANWGGDTECRNSTTTFIISIDSAPIYWRNKRQTILALSYAEAEYIALSSGAKKVSWMQYCFW